MNALSLIVFVLITAASRDVHAFVGPFSKLWSVVDIKVDEMGNLKFMGHVKVPVERAYKKGWKLAIKFDRDVFDIEVVNATFVECTKAGIQCTIENDPTDLVGDVGDNIEFFVWGTTADDSYPKVEVKYKGITYGEVKVIEPPTLDGEAIPTDLPSDGPEPTTVITTTTTTTVSTEPPKPLFQAKVDYKNVIALSHLFFEAQRSGWVEDDTSISWKRDSGLYDGGVEGVDLIGGYYLRGGFVKFNFPTAFAITQLSWGGITYWDGYFEAGEVDNLLKTIKWGTDFLMKSHPEDNVFYMRIGDPAIDHAVWESSSSMNWERPAMRLDAENPASDVAAEASAALISASMLFRGVAPDYVDELERHAIQLFDFADQFRGSHKDVNYQSAEYMDELVWAALWLYKATGRGKYLKFAQTNYPDVLLNSTAENGMDYGDKTLGIQILMAEVTGDYETYMQPVYDFCDQPGGETAFLLDDGLLTRPFEVCPVSFASNAAFICTFAAVETSVKSKRAAYVKFIKNQVHRILGESNTQGYMVGYKDNYPQQIHHRDGSCPLPPSTCGWDWYNDLENPNNHLVKGAIVGGPSSDGAYVDERTNWEHNQPSLLFNAPFQSAVAFLLADRSKAEISINGSLQMDKALTYSPVSLTEYFQREERKFDACVSNPCENNADCKTITIQKWFCSCPDNTFGLRCESKYEPEISWINKWDVGAEIYIYLPSLLDVNTQRLNVIWPKDCPLKDIKVWDTCIIHSQSSFENNTVSFQQVGWFAQKPRIGMTFEFTETGYGHICFNEDAFRYEIVDIDFFDPEYEEFVPETCIMQIPIPPPPPTTPEAMLGDEYNATEATERTPLFVHTIPPVNVPVASTELTVKVGKPLIEWTNQYSHGGQANLNIGDMKPNREGGWKIKLTFPEMCTVTSVQFWNACGIPEGTSVIGGVVNMEQVGWQLYIDFIGFNANFGGSNTAPCFDASLYSIEVESTSVVTNPSPDGCNMSF